MKYIKTYESDENQFNIGDYVKLNTPLESGKIYIINNKTKVSDRPYFLVPIDDELSPKLPLLKRIVPATKEEVEKEKIELNLKKYNL